MSGAIKRSAATAPDIFTPGPTPLYARVASMLRERIRGGEWSSGSQIPTIDDLRESYQVSEITLRQAIRTLSDEGLLSSQRGRGTFVTAVAAPSEQFPVDVALEQFSALDKSHRIHILRRDRNVGPPLWDWNPGSAAQSYVRINKLHTDGKGEPYAHFEMHVESKLFARLPPRSEEKDKIIRLVRTHGGVTVASARERMTIGIAEFSEANALGCPVGLPVARIKRAFMDKSGLVLVYGAITYRGDRLLIERDFTNAAK